MNGFRKVWLLVAALCLFRCPISPSPGIREQRSRERDQERRNLSKEEGAREEPHS